MHVGNILFLSLSNIPLCLYMYTYIDIYTLHLTLFVCWWPLSLLPCLQFSSVAQSSWLFAIPWTAARQASLSITNSRSPPKAMSIKSVMPSSCLMLCRPLLLLPSIFPSFRVFSNESAQVLELPNQSFQWIFSWKMSKSDRVLFSPNGLQLSHCLGKLWKIWCKKWLSQKTAMKPNRRNMSS